MFGRKRRRTLRAMGMEIGTLLEGDETCVAVILKCEDVDVVYKGIRTAEHARDKAKALEEAAGLLELTPQQLRDLASTLPESPRDDRPSRDMPRTATVVAPFCCACSGAFRAVDDVQACGCGGIRHARCAHGLDAPPGVQ